MKSGKYNPSARSQKPGKDACDAKCADLFILHLVPTLLIPFVVNRITREIMPGADDPSILCFCGWIRDICVNLLILWPQVSPFPYQYVGSISPYSQPSP